MDGGTGFIEFVGNLLGTLVAAFLGAWAAFKLESSDRKKQDEEENVAAGNRALFTLLRIWNQQKQYQLEIVDRWRTREDAWFNFPAGMPLSDPSLVFDMKELSFVLQIKGAVFQYVFLEGDRFRNVAQMIDDRNNVILLEAWPRMSAAGLAIGQQMDVNEVKKILTTGVVRQLEILTAGIIKFIDENVVSSRSVFRDLRTALKEIYPKQKFIDFIDEQTPKRDSNGTSKTS